MKLKTISVLSMLCFSTAFALGNTLTSVSIYGTPLIYKDSIAKKDGYFLGSYIYFGYGLNHLLEAEVDYTRINFKNGNKFNQTDFSTSYTNFYKYNKFRIGAHFIKNNENTLISQRYTDNGTILFLGYSRFKPYQWELGGEIYASYYPNYKLNSKTLKVFQLNGIFTYGKGNYYKTGRTYITLKPYFIYLPESPTKRENYISLEGSFSYYIGKWIVSGIGYIGKTIFSVKNNGFLVYNVAEERLYGLGGSIKYIFNKNASVYISIFSEAFKDELSDNKASLTTITLGAGFSF